MELPLTGRVALVTGASSGIGRAIAVALAAEGADVGLVARDRARLDATAELAAAARPSVHTCCIVADLGIESACGAAVEQVRTGLGPIDILVSVAGGAENANVLELARADVTDAIGMKLLATMTMAQAVAPAMRDRGWGRIITVAGNAGVDPRPDNLATSISNLTVLGLTRALSDALAADGITVNAICPGPTDTERGRRNLQHRADREGRTVAEVRADAEAALPAGRMARPEDIASVACFLASDAAAYVHGNALYLDGGSRRGIS